MDVESNTDVLIEIENDEPKSLSKIINKMNVQKVKHTSL